MNGAPQLAMRSHDTAEETCSGSSPISSAAGCAISCSTAITTMPIATASQVDCTPCRTASSRRPAPYRRADMAVVP